MPLSWPLSAAAVGLVVLAAGAGRAGADPERLSVGLFDMPCAAAVVADLSFWLAASGCCTPSVAQLQCATSLRATWFHQQKKESCPFAIWMPNDGTGPRVVAAIFAQHQTC